MTRYFIGIAGGSGAGKTTLANNIKRALPGKVAVIRFDDYGERRLAPRVNGRINWDHPRAFNFKKLRADLNKLRAGRPIKIHSRGNHHSRRTTRTWIEVKPKEYIVLEGFLSLADKEVRDLLDVKIFLDADFNTLLERRPEPTTPTYAEKILKPMFTQYVRPTKRYARTIDVTAVPVERMFLNDLATEPRPAKVQGATRTIERFPNGLQLAVRT